VHFEADISKLREARSFEYFSAIAFYARDVHAA